MIEIGTLNCWLGVFRPCDVSVTPKTMSSADDGIEPAGDSKPSNRVEMSSSETIGVPLKKKEEVTAHKQPVKEEDVVVEKAAVSTQPSRQIGPATSNSNSNSTGLLSGFFSGLAASVVSGVAGAVSSVAGSDSPAPSRATSTQPHPQQPPTPSSKQPTYLQLGAAKKKTYRDLGTLAYGAQSRVSLCIHLPTNSRVAVKSYAKPWTITTYIWTDAAEKAIEEGLKEAAVGFRLLGHPHVTRLLDAFETPDEFVLVFPLLRGGNLRALLDERLAIRDRDPTKPLMSEVEAATILACVASALDYAHRLGLVHRDIKTDNIVFGARDDVRSVVVADWGVADQVGEVEIERSEAASGGASGGATATATTAASEDNARNESMTPKLSAAAEPSTDAVAIAEPTTPTRLAKGKYPDPELYPPTSHNNSSNLSNNNNVTVDLSPLDPPTDLGQPEFQVPGMPPVTWDQVVAEPSLPRPVQKRAWEAPNNSAPPQSQLPSSPTQQPQQPQPTHPPKLQRQPSLLTRPAGTPSILAPEILMSLPYSTPADIWALGCLAYALCCGYSPFGRPQPRDFGELRMRVLDFPRVGFSESEWIGCSLGWREFVSNSLKVRPGARWTAREAMESLWVREMVGEDVIRGLVRGNEELIKGKVRRGGHGVVKKEEVDEEKAGSEDGGRAHASEQMEADVEIKEDGGEVKEEKAAVDEKSKEAEIETNESENQEPSVEPAAPAGVVEQTTSN